MHCWMRALQIAGIFDTCELFKSYWRLIKGYDYKGRFPRLQALCGNDSNAFKLKSRQELLLATHFIQKLVSLTNWGIHIKKPIFHIDFRISFQSQIEQFLFFFIENRIHVIFVNFMWKNPLYLISKPPTTDFSAMV